MQAVGLPDMPRQLASQKGGHPLRHPHLPPRLPHALNPVMSTPFSIPSAPPLSTFERWPEERLKTSREAALKDWCTKQDIWVFGYGSLIWTPEFDFVEQRPA